MTNSSICQVCGASQPSPAATVETGCCKGFAPRSECRCEVERKAAGHPPYHRSSAGNAGATSEQLRWEALESSGHNKRARKMFLAAAEEIERLSAAPQEAPDISAGMTKAMEIVGEMRMSEAGIFDAKHSGQRGEDRSNALYDAYVAIRSALSRPLSRTGEA